MAQNNKNKSVGALGERLSIRFLEQKGYKILSRNTANIRGEIDILCEKDKIIHFVEIKTVTRENENSDGVSYETTYNPEENVHPEKLRRMVRAAEVYMMSSRSKKEIGRASCRERV